MPCLLWIEEVHPRTLVPADEPFCDRRDFLICSSPRPFVAAAPGAKPPGRPAAVTEPNHSLALPPGRRANMVAHLPDADAQALRSGDRSLQLRRSALAGRVAGGNTGWELLLFCARNPGFSPKSSYGSIFAAPFVLQQTLWAADERLHCYGIRPTA